VNGGKEKIWWASENCNGRRIKEGKASPLAENEGNVKNEKGQDRSVRVSMETMGWDSEEGKKGRPRGNSGNWNVNL